MHADGSTTCVYVNDYSPNRNSGTDGIKIIDKSTSDAIKAASRDLTIAQAQGAAQWEACTLIGRFSVADPDDPDKIYTFDTSGVFNFPRLFGSYCALCGSTA